MNNHSLKFFSIKFLLLLTVFSFFLFPLVSAVEVDMNSNYSQGETLIAHFSGNFINQITPNNVKFYRDGHVPTYMVYDVGKINGDFYVYALLTGKPEGNYSIDIHGVSYYKGSTIVSDDIVNNFTISNETAYFSITPGFVITNGEFHLTMQNLQDNSITVNYGIYNSSSSTSGTNFFASFFGFGSSSSQTTQGSITIKSGEIKNASFSVDNFSTGLNVLKLSSGNTTYFIPVYLNANVSSQEPTENNTVSLGENGLEFQPSSINVSIPTNSSSKKIIYFVNVGNETVNNILFNISSDLSPYVVLSPDSISSMDPGTNRQIEIDLVSPNQQSSVNGEITASSENSYSSLTFTLNFIKDFIPSVQDNSTIITTCSDLNGTVCSDTQVCGGGTADLSEGVCCLSTCQDQTSSSPVGSIIGWGLLVLLIIVVYIFYRKKYKNVPKKQPF